MNNPLLPRKRTPEKRDVVSTDMKYRKVIATWNGSISETASLCSVSNDFVKKVLANPKAVSEIRARLDKECSHLIADRAERAMMATQIMRNEENAASDRLRASDQLNKMDGEYVQTHVVEGGSPIKAEFTLAMDQRMENLLRAACMKAQGEIIDAEIIAEEESEED